MLATAQKHDDDLPYWAFFWPPAVGLGMLLASESLLAGRTIIELGAGSAVTGLAAATAGGKVLLTDYLQEAIDLCAYNAAKNNIRADVMKADWKNIAIWPHGADVIIGSEVLYEPEAAETIVALVASPVLRPGGIVAIIDPGRPFISILVCGLEKHGFSVERAQLLFDTVEGSQEATLITAYKGSDANDVLLSSLRSRALKMKPDEKLLATPLPPSKPPPCPPPAPPANFWSK